MNPVQVIGKDDIPPLLKAYGIGPGDVLYDESAPGPSRRVPWGAPELELTQRFAALGVADSELADADIAVTRPRRCPYLDATPTSPLSDGDATQATQPQTPVSATRPATSEGTPVSEFASCVSSHVSEEQALDSDQWVATSLMFHDYDEEYDFMPVDDEPAPLSRAAPDGRVVPSSQRWTYGQVLAPPMTRVAVPMVVPDVNVQPTPDIPYLVLERPAN